MLTFDDPVYLYIAPFIIGALAVLFKLTKVAIKKRFQRFASNDCSKKQKKNGDDLKKVRSSCLTIFALAFILITLSRPQWGEKIIEQKSQSLDIIIALDTSQSMLAKDVSPSRLQRAKLAINDFLNKIEGDRIGLIAFAGKALLQCPLTLDYDAVRQTLESLEPGVIKESGTNLAAAIKEANASFLFNDMEKILILITDGEDLEGVGLAQARQAYSKGLKVYTLGVGSTQGAFIPDDEDPRRNLKDTEGNPVLTRLDPETLSALAQAAGGVYRSLGQTNDGLDWIYQKIVASATSQKRETNNYLAPIERFQWPLALAILFLIAELLIRNRLFLLRRPHPLILIVFINGIIFFTELPVTNASLQETAQYYKNGQYETALAEYLQAIEQTKQPASIYYNIANTHYRLLDYEKAKEAYQKALMEAKNTSSFQLQEKCFYNLGNTQYRLGEKTLASEPDKTIALWEESIRSFHSARELNPKNLKAKENAEWVRQKLDALQKQKNEQQPQSSDSSSSENSNQQPQPDQQASNQKKLSENNNPASAQEDEKTSPTEQQQTNENANNSAQSSQFSQNDDNAQSTADSEQTQPKASHSSDFNAQSESANSEQKADDSPEQKSTSDKPAESESNEKWDNSGLANNRAPEDPKAENGPSQEAFDNPTDPQNVLLMRPEEARQLLQALRTKEKKLPSTQEQNYSSGNKDKTW